MRPPPNPPSPHPIRAPQWLTLKPKDPVQVELEGSPVSYRAPGLPRSLLAELQWCAAGCHGAACMDGWGACSKAGAAGTAGWLGMHLVGCSAQLAAATSARHHLALPCQHPRPCRPQGVGLAAHHLPRPLPSALLPRPRAAAGAGLPASCNVYRVRAGHVTGVLGVHLRTHAAPCSRACCRRAWRPRAPPPAPPRRGPSARRP